MVKKQAANTSWLEENIDRVLVVLLAFATVSASLVVGLYLWQFGNNGISDDQGKWGEFGDFLGGTLNPLLAFVALVALLLTLKVQSKELSVSSGELAKASNAARISADIAKEAMIASNRAFVTYLGCRWISHREIGTGRIFWVFHPMWTNRGNTPTRGLVLNVHFLLVDYELPRDYAIDLTAGTTLTSIAPGDNVVSNPTHFYGEDLLAVRDGKKHLYISGIAKYRDIFQGTPQRITK